jgi:hypothetical protein
MRDDLDMGAAPLAPDITVLGEANSATDKVFPLVKSYNLCTHSELLAIQQRSTD